MRAIGAWMEVNSQSIYGTKASPFKELTWGRCTQKPSEAASHILKSPRHAAQSRSVNRANNAANPAATTLYLHVFNWPSDGRLVVPGLKNPVEAATLLATGGILKADSNPDGVVIHIPTEAPDKIASTIALKIGGTPQVD
jgi:alpha-L-fucosidase